MRKPLTLLGMVALLLLVATLALPAAAAPNVCRDLPTGVQAVGAVITVSLAVTDVNGVNWHLVDEAIPLGLTVVDAGGANTATPGHLKWSATSPSPDVTYTYTVTGSAGTYTFDGVYLVSGGDATLINCDAGLEIRDPDHPTVTVTYPVDGTVNGSIDVTADANDDLDPDGSVTQVEFFLIPDGSSIGTDTNGADGWSVSIDTTTVTDGDYQIKAVATDNDLDTGNNTGGVFTIDNSHLCDFFLELDAGWNLVSVPRMLDGQTNAATVFNLSATELCEYYDGCTGSWSTANPSDMNVIPGRGYMVSKASAETRCLNFNDSGTAIPSNQQLCAGGWNMIGFPSLDSMSVADFGTTAIDGNFTMVWQWNSGWEQVSPPDSNNMIPGKGYLLWMTDDGVLLGMIP